MKSLKKTPLALALAALFASPFALANDTNGGYDSATLYTDVYLHNQIYVGGDVYVSGNIDVASESWAVIDSKQKTFFNQVDNQSTENNARMEDNALQNAEGNIGVNIGAGSNNQQANDVALSAVDADFVFANAQVFSKQSSLANITNNLATQNNARLSDDALQYAAGNIGVNIAAGDGNQQQNNLAVSFNTSGTIAKATVAGEQSSLFNYTNNVAAIEYEALEITLAGIAFGAYAGVVDQYGDQYLDTWGPCVVSTTNTCSNGPQNHPTNGDSTGHVDLDDEIQGAEDRPQPSGLDLAGLTDPSTGGGLSFNEAGDVLLAVGLAGTIYQTVYSPVVNNAIVDSYALQNAVGNIGVNVAAGTGNMQRNSLAVAVAVGGGGNGGGGGGE